MSGAGSDKRCCVEGSWSGLFRVGRVLAQCWYLAEICRPAKVSLDKAVPNEAASVWGERATKPFKLAAES